MIHMKTVCLYSEQIDKEIFNLNNPIINRDNCMYSLSILRQEFKKLDYDLLTPDDILRQKSDIVLYLEMPKDLPLESEIHKSYLLLFETELIRPDNWNLSSHKRFQKIFTWRDDLVDNKRYFKINWAYLVPDSISVMGQNKNKMCTLIAGNKSSSHPLELYSKRKVAIRWFERNHPENFDLFGRGWKNNQIMNKIAHLPGLCYLTRIFNDIFRYYPSYRGKIKTKNEILKEYKFCICYENAKDIPGYITEKIFDCFFSACVPIYWGANNVHDHIPSNTFIDRRKFSSYEELYEYISHMPENEYENYLQNIAKFLRSDQIIQFSAECFAKTIVKQITLDQKSAPFNPYPFEKIDLNNS